MTSADFLTCGLCQREFPLAQIVTFMQHKKYDCDIETIPQGLLHEVEKLQKYSCVSCPEKFAAAVTLLQHVQFVHRIKIFMEGIYGCQGSKADTLSNPPKPTDGKSSTLKTAVEPGSTGAQATLLKRESESSEVVPLKRCCASVVPKKRKRHIETKHSAFYGGSSASKGRRRPSFGTSVEGQDDEEGDTIYIDVNPSSSPRSGRDGSDESNRGQMNAVILQRGSTYSIPSSLPYVGITYGNRTGATSAPSQKDESSYKLSRQTCGGPTRDSPSSAGAMDMKQASDEDEGINGTGSGCSEGGKKLLRSGRSRSNGRSSSKPYKCDQCEHSFNQRIHLQKHLSKHTGVKPYKCQQCDYATVERSHLKVHIRIHTGEKPFKCTYCEYATAQNSTLKIHLKRHHTPGGDILLDCSQCGKSFPEKSEFNAHQKEHGGGEGESSKQCASSEAVVASAEPERPL